MNLLLDTHILLWHLADNSKLSFEASDLIENDAHQKFLSIVSWWEIEIKRNIGKLDITQPIETLLPKEIIILPIKNRTYRPFKKFTFSSPRPI